MKTPEEWTEITVSTDDGEIIASITPDNIIVKGGYEIRMRPDYDK